MQTALANAAVNGFVVNFSQNFVHCVEDVGDNIGQIDGTVVNIDGIDVSILATVNASKGDLVLWRILREIQLVVQKGKLFVPLAWIICRLWLSKL